MDKLEKIISDNSDHFNDEQPNEGHMERFEMKLRQAKKNKTHLPITKYWWAVAAAIVVALLVFFPSQQNHDQPITLSEVSEQYAQIEYYYTSSIQLQTNHIKTLNEQMGNDESIQLLVKELEEYDRVYEQLCSELNATPNDERVINALITYYQTKLEITQKIIENIELKFNNNTKNENIDI